MDTDVSAARGFNTGAKMVPEEEGGVGFSGGVEEIGFLLEEEEDASRDAQLWKMIREGAAPTVVSEGTINILALEAEGNGRKSP